MANTLGKTVGDFLKRKASFQELRAAFDEALQPLRAKMVAWEEVRDIANQLCNQLEMGEGVDMTQAHMSDFRGGPQREFACEPGRKGFWRDANWNGNGWFAFDEADVSRLFWSSLSSGSMLEAEKKEPGKWELTFTPSKEDPLYRGSYFDLYQKVEEIREDPAVRRAMTLVPIMPPSFFE